MKDRRLLVWRVILVIAALLLVGSIVQVLVRLIGGTFDLIAVVDLIMGVLLVTAAVLNLHAIVRQRHDRTSTGGRSGR